jgi:DNA-binding FadR family transcriptional regulator
VAGDLDTTIAVDVQLHLAIAEASRNQVLADLYRDLLGAISENVTFNVTRLPSIEDDDHVGLVAAIVDGDPDRAAREAARFLDELLRSNSTRGG